MVVSVFPSQWLNRDSSVVERETDCFICFAVEVECCLIEIGWTGSALGIVGEAPALGGHTQRIPVQLAVAILVVNGGHCVLTRRKTLEYKFDFAGVRSGLLFCLRQLRLAETGLVIHGD